MSDKFSFSSTSDISAAAIDKSGLAALRAFAGMSGVKLGDAALSTPFASQIDPIAKGAESLIR